MVALSSSPKSRVQVDFRATPGGAVGADLGIPGGDVTADAEAEGVERFDRARLRRREQGQAGERKQGHRGDLHDLSSNTARAWTPGLPFKKDNVSS